MIYTPDFFMQFDWSITYIYGIKYANVCSREGHTIFIMVKLIVSHSVENISTQGCGQLSAYSSSVHTCSCLLTNQRLTYMCGSQIKVFFYYNILITALH